MLSKGSLCVFPVQLYRVLAIIAASGVALSKFDCLIDWVHLCMPFNDCLQAVRHCDHTSKVKTEYPSVCSTCTLTPNRNNLELDFVLHNLR